MTKTQITQQDLTLRRGSAICMILALWLYARPFTPGLWVAGHELGYTIDNFIAWPIFTAGLYFQWRIASALSPVPILITLPGGSPQRVVNGRVESGGEVFSWVYDPAQYWMYLAGEAGVLGGIWYAEMEVVRRVYVCGVFGALWGVGWFCTPASTRRWAWEQVKQIWMWIAVNEVISGVRRGGQKRRW